MKDSDQETKPDAIEFLKRRFFGDGTEAEAAFEAEVANLKIGMDIYDLRKSLKLSRKAFAKKVGISIYALQQLEEAWYTGSAAEMRDRIQTVFSRIEKRSRVG